MFNGCFFFGTKSAMNYMDRAMYKQELPFQIILISLMGQIGSAGRPVVTFNPNWNKFLPGDSVRLSCNVEPAASSYDWYRNDNVIYRGKNYVIGSAWMGDPGEYKCRANTDSTESEVVTLSVSHGAVILQAPLYIYEGDNISLQCHSVYDLVSSETTFYRNNQTIQKSPANYNLLSINNTDLTATYTCSKQLLTSYIYSLDTIISYTGSSGAIQVTITPGWKKLLTGDSVTMTCHGGSDVTYRWSQDGAVVAEGATYTISSARVGHSGTYQCQTSRGHSLPFQLEVSHGPVILQAPIFVHERTNINLRCHSRPEYSVHGTTFYKNNNAILYTMSYHSVVVLYGNSDVSGIYRCERRLSRDEYVTYTDEVSLHVRDLFTKPNITPMLRPMAEGDTMTLTCDTSLSPLRPRTELQFAFYRDGRNVQEFGSSNQYGVQSAQLEDSGNYSCEVRTPTNSVMKRSERLYIQIQGTNSSPTTYTILIIVFILLFLITIVAVVVVIKHRRKPSLTSTSRRPTMDPPEAESSRGLSREGDSCYAQEPAANSTADEEVCYADLRIGKKASSPRASEKQVVYSEIRARLET